LKFNREDWEALKRKASLLGLKPGELIRRALRRELSREAVLEAVKGILASDREMAEEVKKWLDGFLSVRPPPRLGGKVVRTRAVLTPEQAEELKQKGFEVRKIEDLGGG